jgi:RNA polymerase sigma-70 factor (ECF subfamily)
MNKMNNDIDHIEASKKDPSCFEAIYNKYYEQILKFVYKRMTNSYDCEEVTSIVFSKALMNIGKYKYLGFPFSSWLYRIAINEINQFYRDNKKHRVVNITEANAKYISDEIDYNKMDSLEKLESSLQSLSAEELLLIELRFFDGKPFAEIGEILEITENNAKVKTYRILDKLKLSFFNTI